MTVVSSRLMLKLSGASNAGRNLAVTEMVKGPTGVWIVHWRFS